MSLLYYNTPSLTMCQPVCLAPLICLLLLVFVRAEIFSLNERRVLPGNRPPPASPWPMPAFWRHDTSVFLFTPSNLTFNSDLSDCDLIESAYKRLLQQLEIAANYNQAQRAGVSDPGPGNNNNNTTDDHNGGVLLQEIKLKVEDNTCPGYPQLGVQENYTLEVTGQVSLTASTAWAAIWGLQTLGQLMYMVENQWLINKTFIQDGPRFKHRGLHLDTARHFYNVDILKQNLDAMSINKLNVFHWHIVDTQAFPYRSVRFPQLAQKGAFSAHETYSQQDISDIIEYARLRGIRVLPEFDSPAHVYSWGKGIPELLTTCWSDGQPVQVAHNLHPDKENMDPSRNSTFEFLTEFFQEVADLFVDNYLHLGMDEALYQCWQSNPDITSFMKDVGLAADDYAGLEQYYDERLLDIVNNMNRKPLIWEDPINNGANISKQALVQLWKDYNLSPAQFAPWPTYMKSALAAGYHVIFSSCWYLNYIHYGQDWKDLYTCDPTSINATTEELSRILGGEACTWSEYIDGNNFLQVAWPRAAAVAERLWSPAQVTSTDDAAFRLDQHRCRLIRQGIPAAPISPGFCHHDYNTDNSGVHQLQLLQAQQVRLSTPRTDSVSVTSQQEPIVG